MSATHIKSHLSQPTKASRLRVLGRETTIAILMCISTLPACADVNKKPAVTPSDAAQNEVDVLRNLEPASPKSPLDAIGFIKSLFNDPNDEEFAKGLGFTSAQEVADAQLGSPLRICSVPLDRLQNFHSGDDPNDLLVDTHRLIFPLLVKGQARSSITVMEGQGDEKRWRVVEKGSSKLVQKIQKIQQQNPSSSSFLVLISSLGLRFLGDRKAGQLVLTSIDKNPRLGLQPGNERNAQEAFSELLPSAKHAYETYQKTKESSSKGRENKTLTTGGTKC